MTVLQAIRWWELAPRTTACVVCLIVIMGAGRAQAAPPTTATPLGIEAALQQTVQRMGTSQSPAPRQTLTDRKSAAPAQAPTAVKHVHTQLSRQGLPWIPGPVAHGPCDRNLDQYRGRALEMIEDPHPTPEAGWKADLGMWWDDPLSKPMGLGQQTIPVDVATLTHIALASSPYVKSVLTEPRIRQCDVVIADAEFDSTMFLEGKYADTSEPRNSLLQTGDARFRDDTYSQSGGFRKKLRRGGELEMIQRGGFQENNGFIDPNPQGTARLEINYSQPLLRDGGKAVNNIGILLAQLDLQVTNSQVRADLEDHLIDVTAAYWDLYQARAEWLQRERLLKGAEHLYHVLQARGDVDSQKRQILRALAAAKSRKSDLARAVTRIRNAQSKLRLLTGSVELIHTRQFELTPQDRPLALPVNVSTKDSVVTALDNRPEIAEAIRRVQAVSARVGVARNQVLPRMDMILGTYVAGVRADRDILGSWVDQFSEGRPSYYFGLAYELPVGNRASKARLNRNRWEFSRAMYEFHQATEVTFTEVEIAVRETQTAFTEMVTKKQAVDAAANEVLYLQDRWDHLPDPNESATLLIEDLLDAQERLADEERDFVAAQTAYALSWVGLRKAMGVLLRFDDLANRPVAPPMEPTPHVQPLEHDATLQGASQEAPQQ